MVEVDMHDLPFVVKGFLEGDKELKQYQDIFLVHPQGEDYVVETINSIYMKDKKEATTIMNNMYLYVATYLLDPIYESIHGIKVYNNINELTYEYATHLAIIKISAFLYYHKYGEHYVPKIKTTETMGSGHSLLGIEPGMSLKQIKDVYRKKMKVLHPDAGGNAAEFMRVREAYEEMMKEDIGYVDISDVDIGITIKGFDTYVFEDKNTRDAEKIVGKSTKIEKKKKLKKPTLWNITFILLGATCVLGVLFALLMM